MHTHNMSEETQRDVRNEIALMSYAAPPPPPSCFDLRAPSSSRLSLASRSGRKLRHPNVLQFLGAQLTPPNICIIMEFVSFLCLCCVHTATATE